MFLKGYAFPGRERHGIKNFVLVRDNLQCCFGGNPKLTDMVEVKLAGNLAMDFTTNLRRVAEGTENTMPAIIEAVKAYATLGEIMDVFRAAFGDYMEPAVF